jgi:hypothetical protein
MAETTGCFAGAAAKVLPVSRGWFIEGGWRASGVSRMEILMAPQKTGADAILLAETSHSAPCGVYSTAMNWPCNFVTASSAFILNKALPPVPH